MFARFIQLLCLKNGPWKQSHKLFQRYIPLNGILARFSLVCLKTDVTKSLGALTQLQSEDRTSGGGRSRKTVLLG